MEWNLPLHLDVVAIEKGALRSPLTTVTNFTFICHIDEILLGSVILDQSWPESNVNEWVLHTPQISRNGA